MLHSLLPFFGLLSSRGEPDLNPSLGDTGEETETIEVLPTEEPLSVPAPTPAPAEPVKEPEPVH